jgi:hypothetical protein
VKYPAADILVGYKKNDFEKVLQSYDAEPIAALDWLRA